MAHDDVEHNGSDPGDGGLCLDPIFAVPLAGFFLMVGSISLGLVTLRTTAAVTAASAGRSEVDDLRQRMTRLEREHEECIRERAGYIRENTVLLRQLARLEEIT